MQAMTNSKITLRLRLGLCLASAAVAIGLMWLSPAGRNARGQDNREAEAGAAAAEGAAEAAPRPVPAPKDKTINIFELAIAGGIFMIPIAGMSILAVTMAFERLLALRTQRVLPSGLVAGLGELAEGKERFDPRR